VRTRIVIGMLIGYMFSAEESLVRVRRSWPAFQDGGPAHCENLTFTRANRRSTIKINVLGLVRLGAVDPNIRTSLYNLLFYKETAAL